MIHGKRPWPTTCGQSRLLSSTSRSKNGYFRISAISSTALSTILDIIDNIRDGHVIIMITRYIKLVRKGNNSLAFYLIFKDDKSFDLLIDHFVAKILKREFI